MGVLPLLKHKRLFPYKWQTAIKAFQFHQIIKLLTTKGPYATAEHLLQIDMYV